MDAQPSRKRKAAASSIWQKEFRRPNTANLRRLIDEKAAGDPWNPVANAMGEINFNAGGIFSLARIEVVDMYVKAGRSPMFQKVIEYYIQLICHHINTQSGRAEQQDVPVCITWGDPHWRSLQNLENVSTILNADNLDKTNFLRVRHVLVPILADPPRVEYLHHSWLLDISPLAKTVEVFNSEPLARPIRPDPELEVPPGGFIICKDDLLVSAFAVLDAHLGRDFKPREWKVRTGRSPLQGNTDNCGVFSCTNAMHTAFGYPINYHGNDMKNKRLRIASEILNGGFADNSAFADDHVGARDEFYYPLPLLNWTDVEFELQYPTLESGFRPVPVEVLKRLPAKVRNKRGRYDHINVKREMRYMCRERGELRDVSMTCSGPTFTLDQFKEACEERDEAIRTRTWPLR